MKLKSLFSSLSLCLLVFPCFASTATSVEEHSESLPFFSGFFDLQHVATHSEGGLQSDVLLNDSALYFNTHSEFIGLSADLPFQANGMDHFKIPKEKVQLFFDYKIPASSSSSSHPIWRGRWGQFDSPF